MLQIIGFPLSVLCILYEQWRLYSLPVSQTIPYPPASPPPKAIQCNILPTVCRTTPSSVFAVHLTSQTPHSCLIFVSVVSSLTPLNFTTVNEKEMQKTTFSNLSRLKVTTIPTVPRQSDFSSDDRENTVGPLMGSWEFGR